MAPRRPAMLSGYLRPLLRSLGLFGCKLSAHCLHHFASCCNPFPAVRRRVNQLFEADSKLGIGSSDSTKQRLYFREDPNVLAVGVIEKLRTDRSVVDERCRHLPIG